MGERIYVMNETDSQQRLEPMGEERFASEDKLQELIAKHPELLGGEQMTPEDPRRWVLITREKGITTPDGANWWALDHLYIDQDAVPTLVEVKLGANPEVRRKVVGQMLDYAAHAEHWTVDELRAAFEKSNHPGALRRLLGEGEEEEAAQEDFWEHVGMNLKAKRLRLLFVADEIPDTLARVVEFLNEQMPRIEVLAVEIKQFRSASGQMILVPRVIGRIEPTGPGSSRVRTKATLEEFMNALPSDEVRKATDRLFAVARKHGARIVPGDKGFSIRIACRLWQPLVTVAWFYPPSDSSFWMGLRNFAFGAGILEGYDPPPSAELSRVLEGWIGQFSDDEFGEDYPSEEGPWARLLSHDDVGKHIDVLAERLDKVLSDLKAL